MSKSALRVVGIGSLGFVLAGAVQAIREWISASPVKDEECKLVQHKANEAYPNPAAFHLDPEIYRIMNRLVKFEYRQPKAYQQILVWMDRLLFLEMQLRNHETRPKFNDVPLTQDYITNIEQWSDLLLAVDDYETSALSA